MKHQVFLTRSQTPIQINSATYQPNSWIWVGTVVIEKWNVQTNKLYTPGSTNIAPLKYGGPGLIEDVMYGPGIEHGDFPASKQSLCDPLPGGTCKPCKFLNKDAAKNP